MKIFNGALGLLCILFLSGCASIPLMTEIPADEVHVQMSSAESDGLRKILKRQPPHRDLFIAPTIPAHKLQNARKFCVVPKDEVIFAVISGTSDDILLIGSSGIFFYTTTIGRNYISYTDFWDMNISKGGWMEVSIGGANFITAGCSYSVDELISFLTDVQKYIATGTSINKGKMDEKMAVLTLAVIDFEAKNPVTQQEATFATEIFRGHIVKSKIFKIVDKKNMDMILSEQTFQQTGITASEKIIQMGKILNVQMMITGSFGKMLSRYMITVTLLKVETGEVIYSDNVDFVNDTEINSKILELTDRLAGQWDK